MPEAGSTSLASESDAERPARERIVGSFLWQGAGTFVGQGVSWIATIIVIRLLAPADYGLMAMANLCFGLLVLLGDFGVGAAAVQAARIDVVQLRKLAGLTLAAGVGAGLVVLATAPWVARFFEEPRLTVVLRTLSVAFLLIASYTLPQALLVRELNFRLKAAVDVAATAVSALTALGLALLGFGVWALVGSVLALHGTRAVAFNVARPVGPAFAFSAVGNLVRIGALITVDRVLFFLIGNADMAVAGRVLGGELLGVYSVAVTLSTVPLEKVLPTVVQVSFAALSRMQAEPERLRRNVLRATRLVSLLLSPAFLGLAAVAPDLIPVLLGPKWQAAVVPIQLLCLVLPLRAVGGLLPPALFAIGRPGVNVANMAITLGIMIAAFIVGVRYGVTGVALAWLAAYPLVFAIAVVRASSTLGLTARQVLAAAGRPWLASAVMVVGVLALRSLIGAALAPVPALLLVIVAGAATYAGAIWVLDREAVMELRSVLRS